MLRMEMKPTVELGDLAYMAICYVLVLLRVLLAENCVSWTVIATLLLSCKRKRGHL